jgi:hypothetical protein
MVKNGGAYQIMLYHKLIKRNLTKPAAMRKNTLRSPSQ